ncbi:MAG: hypothetical protein IJT65_02265, partial [Eubacterium sp.]|nr:hypothetical protein [Eubacterium sp.]
MGDKYIIFFAIAFIADIIIGGILYPNAGHPKVTLKAFLLKMAASSIFLLNGAIAYLDSSQNNYAKLV